MPEKQDDLDAVRAVATALEPFNAEDRHRIVRWASEKLGLTKPPGQTTSPAHVAVTAHAVDSESSSAGLESRAGNIKQFLAEKDPKSETQFAAAVAYYYRFEVPEKEKKETITREDLLEACRQAGRPRLNNPAQTLVNAHAAGLLDKGKEKGTYSVNTVGENLVAMTLPAGAGSSSRTVVKRARRAPDKKGRRKQTKR